MTSPNPQPGQLWRVEASPKHSRDVRAIDRGLIIYWRGDETRDRFCTLPTWRVWAKRFGAMLVRVEQVTA